MFDVSVFTEYFVPIVAVVCLIIGYLIKNCTPITNKYIPLILSVVGVVANIFNCGTFNLEVFIGGAFTGLAATGLHSAFKHLVEGSGDEQD